MGDQRLDSLRSLLFQYVRVSNLLVRANAKKGSIEERKESSLWSPMVLSGRLKTGEVLVNWYNDGRSGLGGSQVSTLSEVPEGLQ
jgi:hypothetical protein